ncbi:MAG: oligoribonuclease [Chromatiales bacterium 21-64-14]|nr:MAG: oligoribonuclease [Chromatiales bacterium 21-64-14]HQU16742.1 oligoribonuclease [Gammaproteobacteria bacterium]
MARLDPGNLIWIDLEMTGLDTDRDHILEIATIVTDSRPEILAEGPVLAIHQTDAVLEQMDNWNQNQHTKSGLIERVRRSRVDVEEAQLQTLEFLKLWVPANVSPMCGNSICQDRRFLHRWMPRLEQYFHYRHLDVSTLKELAKRWAPRIAAGFEKTPSHLALDDVRDSIRELRYYREQFFNFSPL